MWNPVRRLARPLWVAATAVGLGALPSAAVWAAEGAQGAAGQSQPEAQAAVWTPKETQFTYMGFTTRYSCDGLRDTIKDWLLQLGARKDDLKINEQPCSGDPNVPNPFPGVKIKMSVLTPAPANLPVDTKTVPGQWQTVKLPYREFGINAAGQCELLEQFKQKILPLFTTRNVDLRASCVPHQLEPVGTKLQVDVLKTDQKKDPTKEASAAEQR
jgi:hypothetical protein